ncbi:hypothetical protein [Bradyrhizobium sp. dw_78]|uniref:hypothetical protein n=1 Tax=Bradyrhizobium sp. dw_78 TaxID=2719793 RepID=UPI001BD5A7C0|nr:hypothetical protein [Bradyrhizobium sp. dw_78]
MWIGTILLTLLFFLICLGFGLFILAMSSIAVIEKSHLTKLEMIVLGLTIGGPGTSIFLQLLSLIYENLYADLGILLLISLAGFAATTNIWLPRREDRDELALWATLSISAALITWWWSFGAFSDFPFGDIGADVHWIKTAQEYADTGIINPYASQSYPDLRSALAGALSGTFGLDLLQFNWSYRYFSILCLMIFFYSIADGLFLDRHRKWFAFSFAAATNTLGLLTNGSLAVASSFVFLSALIKTGAKTDRSKVLSVSTLTAAGGAFLSILSAFLLNNNALMLALMAAAALAFNVLNRSGNIAKKIASNAFVSVMWSMALMLAHRGAYLFVPISIFGWLFYIGVVNVISGSFLRSKKALWILSLALPSICMLVLANVVATRLGYIPAVRGDEFFSHITLLVFGKPIEPGDDMVLGAGSDVAAIEISRAIGPLFAAGIGLMIAWWCATHRPARLAQSINSQSQGRNIALLFWSWISGCVLCMVALSGFPFLYRIAFIISGLFTVTATELFFQLFKDPIAANSSGRRIVAVITAAVVAALVIGVYSFSWTPNLGYSGYQAMLRPLEMTGVALVLLSATLTFAPVRRLQIFGLAVVIGLSVVVDRSGISALFKVYSYGQLPDHATAVSHYDASDLKTALWLHNNIRDFVIVSDPYTLGFAEAITGAPGIYLFSNLDTVNEMTASRVKRVISAITETTSDTGGQALRACKSLFPLLASLNEEIRAQISGKNLAQGVLKPVKPTESIDERQLLEKDIPHSGADILRQMQVLNGAEKKWNIVTIVNPRTIQWLHLNNSERLSYFPIDEPLKEVSKALGGGPFRTLFSDNQNAVILIECTKDTIGSYGKAF